MSEPISIDLTASEPFGWDEYVKESSRALLDARDEVLADVELWESGGEVPEPKRPLDAGFIPLPERLLESADDGLVGQIERTAARLRDDVDQVVLLGIGGSYMGTRALFEGLCHPYHNELDRTARQGVPRLYCEGNNLDNDTVQALRQLLDGRCQDPGKVEDRWSVIVISKSGGTLETAVAFRLFLSDLERFYADDPARQKSCVVPVTGDAGRLRDLSQAKGYPDVFPIPDGVGGRFSVLSAVGLLPAAALGLDIRRLLDGARFMNQLFRDEPLASNPVLLYTGNCHLHETRHGRHIRILSTWGNRLEALGLWYDQLLAESLGKQQMGATPITAVNTRDLHSRGQQHQEGRPDKLITNLIVNRPSSAPAAIPESEFNQDQLNPHAGKTIPELLDAAFRGTNQAYADDGRPTADIRLPVLDEFTLGQLLQLLMLSTVVEGRLIGINPYGQPGVEAYKRNMTAILNR